MKLFKYFGPSTLVTAAFIGPGTITLCSLTGATTGYQLIWVLLFSVFTAIVFQEMSARLGLITQKGLGEAIQSSEWGPVRLYLMIALSFSAIIIGNAAYEAGNIAGAVLGLDLIWSGQTIWPVIIGGLAGLLLYFGKYKYLEKLLIVLVLLMSLCFMTTSILVKPNLGELFSGFIPRISNFDNILLIIGLIGTTVVPYNLFLHASSVSEKYQTKESLKELRIENIVAIGLGGLISICIIITAGTILKGAEEFNGIADFAKQLEPLLGSYAKMVMAIGFFAAGLSSAITAPLAAAYAAKGLLNLQGSFENKWFRLTWLLILLAGIYASFTGFKPINIIKFAQISNGLLMPVIALFLILAVNNKKLMGEYVNTRSRNLVAGFVLLITILLAGKTLVSVIG